MKRLIHIICIAVIVLLCTNVSGSSFLSFDGEKKDVILRKILKTVHINNRDKDCGCASILYFENPEQTIQLQSYGASLTISE